MSRSSVEKLGVSVGSFMNNANSVRLKVQSVKVYQSQMSTVKRFGTSITLSNRLDVQTEPVLYEFLDCANL
jgi:hypothetical protein